MSPQNTGSGSQSGSNIQVGVQGFVIELTIMNNGKPMDISSAQSTLMIFQDPSGITTQKTAVFSTDGTNGKIRYVTVDDDLSLSGNYQIQAFIVLPTFSGYSGTGSFYVAPNL
jgi:hypothetical protein